jgi:hypothetical protein
MVMRRSFSKRTTMLLTITTMALITALSFAAGYDLAILKEPPIQTSLSQDMQSLETLILTANLNTGNSSLACTLLSSGLATLSQNINIVSQELSESLNSAVLPAQYKQLSNQLNYIRLNFWILVQRANDECKNKFVNLLMFYPGNRTCMACINEGEELSYISALSNYTAIATVLNANSNISAIQALIKFYNITKYPTLIINTKYVIPGYLTTDQIVQHICQINRNFSLCGNLITNLTTR